MNDGAAEKTRRRGWIHVVLPPQDSALGSAGDVGLWAGTRPFGGLGSFGFGFGYPVEVDVVVGERTTGRL